MAARFEGSLIVNQGLCDWKHFTSKNAFVADATSKCLTTVPLTDHRLRHTVHRSTISPLPHQLHLLGNRSRTPRCGLEHPNCTTPGCGEADESAARCIRYVSQLCRSPYVDSCSGAGALVSPLVATQFSEMKRWNFHYLTSLGMAAICLFLVTVTFRFKTIEKLFSDVGYIEVVIDEKSTSPSSTVESTVDQGHPDRRHIRPNEEGIVAEVDESPKPAGSVQKMGKIIRDPVVLLTAAFAFLYVGTEITIGGWIVTFLRTVRGAGPSAGYVSTGFFAGLTLGRVVHVWVARLAPERYALFGYGAIAIALQIVSETKLSNPFTDLALPSFRWSGPSNT